MLSYINQFHTNLLKMLSVIFIITVILTKELVIVTEQSSKYHLSTMVNIVRYSTVCA